MKDMNEYKISQKVLIKLGILYGIILAVINFGGYMIVMTSKLPTKQTISIYLWNSFKSSHLLLIGSAMGIIFMIPFIVLALYLLKRDDVTLPGRIINLPLVYALVGSLGWILPYIFELGCLIYVAKKYDAHMHSIAIFSFFNVVESALFIGTFAFMTLDFVHRHKVLPKYFSEGKLDQFKGVKTLSTRRMIRIFYLSVGLVPIFYLGSVLYNYSYNEGFEVENIIYETVAAFVVIGFIMLHILSHYFTHPLMALRQATDSIIDERYHERVVYISSDDFGVLSDNFNDMAEALEYKTEKIVAIQDSIIKGMAVMVESRDNSTGGHINRTSDCVKILVQKLKREGYRSELGTKYWNDVIKAAPMHDLGKIAIDDAILRKPGKYTPDEYEKMKMHAKEGARIVENVLKEVDDDQFKKIAINVAHYHHEKWDGSGYPTGISREQIPLEARIMALADVFDALVSKRCYKDSMTVDHAFSIIEESLGTHFDPEIGAIFLKCRPELERLYSKEY